MTLENKGPHWSIQITFDAGYALPELRDDAKSPQPQRAWLVAKNAQQHLRLRDEASKYIYATLTVSHGDKQLPYTVSFPDYQSSPPSFPSLLNGGAYFNVVLTAPVIPGSSGDFSLAVSSAAKPSFVVSHSVNESKSYTVITPGSTEVLFSSSGNWHYTYTAVYSQQRQFLHPQNRLPPCIAKWNRSHPFHSLPLPNGQTLAATTLSVLGLHPRP